MRRTFIHPAVALITFAIGTIASGLFYGAWPAPFGMTQPRTLVPHHEFVLEHNIVFSSSCGCEQAEDGRVADEFSVPQTARITAGVLNGKAVKLPQPSYPAIAIAAHASGTVTVQVVIDERGCVISSRAVSGHPLLQSAAAKAGYEACFSPTRLSGQPVKVAGVINYNFVLADAPASRQRF